MTQFFVWENVTGGSVTVSNESVSATAANRIITGNSADVTVTDGGSLWFVYDLTTARWRVVGGAGGSSGATMGTNTTLTAGASLSISLISTLQNYLVAGNSAAVSLSTTVPFGSSAPADGTLVELVGNSDSNTVTLTYSDTAKGAVGNFSTIELAKYQTASFRYISSIDRWVYAQ